MKIPVSVVTGFLGAGKTTAINRFLKESGEAVKPARTAIIVNEIGQAGLDHMLFRQITDNIVLLDSGCLCCSVRGELVGALRDLFMAALHKKITGLDRVIIETTGMADPAPVMYTLQYEPFLHERFAYDGSVAVVDALNGVMQLSAQEEAMQQVLFADLLALSKTDLVAPSGIADLRDVLHKLNPHAPIMSLSEYSLFTLILQAGQAHRLSGWKTRRGRGMDLNWGKVLDSSQIGDGKVQRAREPVIKRAAMSSRHAGIHVLTFQVSELPSRAEFIRALRALQQTASVQVLRIKGLVRFVNESDYCVVQGVHQQLYPFERYICEADDSPAMFLVFVVRASNIKEFEDRVRTLLGCV